MIDISSIATEARPIVEHAAEVYIKHTAPWFIGLLLYGSALRGDFVPGCSDVDFQIYLDASAFEPGDRLPLNLCIAIQRDLATIDLGPFSYIQALAFSNSVREDWVGPVPGTYRLLSGRLPTAEATPEQLRLGAAARLSMLEPVREHLSGLLDHGEHRLESHVRLLISDVWPALKQVLAIQRGDPVGVWSLTKQEAIALLPEDSPMGSTIRNFYAAVRTYYPAQESVDAALAVIEHGVGFLRAAQAWWHDQADGMSP